MMKKVEPSYYAILPANVRYDKRLIPNAKLLFAEITSLCNKEGFCWASNRYFSKLYNVRIETVSVWISQLTKYGYVKSKLIYAEGRKEILNRYLVINDNPILKNLNSPIEEILKDNTTKEIEKFNTNKRGKILK